MLHRVFAVHDGAAGAFLQPFILPSRETALRAISDCVQDKQHNFGRWPASYTLYELGSWDELHGRIDPLEVPENLGPLSQFVSVAAA